MFAKPAIATGSAWLLATIDQSPLFMVGAFALTIVLGWRAFKVREWTVEIAGLNASIATHETIKRGDDQRIKQLEEQLNGVEARARQLEIDAQKWKAAHDALVPYSAAPAFERLADLIAEMARAGDKRHRETIDLIRQLAGEKSVGP